MMIKTVVPNYGINHRALVVEITCWFCIKKENPVRYHSTIMKITEIRKTDQVLTGCWAAGTLNKVGENVKWYKYLGKQFCSLCSTNNVKHLFIAFSQSGYLFFFSKYLLPSCFSLDVCSFYIVFSGFSIYILDISPFNFSTDYVESCPASLHACGHHELYFLGCYIPTDIPKLCSGMQLCNLKTLWYF